MNIYEDEKENNFENPFESMKRSRSFPEDSQQQQHQQRKKFAKINLNSKKRVFEIPKNFTKKITPVPKIPLVDSDEEMKDEEITKFNNSANGTFYSSNLDLEDDNEQDGNEIDEMTGEIQSWREKEEEEERNEIEEINEENQESKIELSKCHSHFHRKESELEESFTIEHSSQSQHQSQSQSQGQDQEIFTSEKLCSWNELNDLNESTSTTPNLLQEQNEDNSSKVILEFDIRRYQKRKKQRVSLKVFLI